MERSLKTRFSKAPAVGFIRELFSFRKGDITLEREATEIQKGLYGSTQDMQMRTTPSQLRADSERAAPPSTAVSGTSDGTERALFGGERGKTGGLLLLRSSSVPGMPRT